MASSLSELTHVTRLPRQKAQERTMLRALVLAGVIAAVVVASLVGHPAHDFSEDVELAHLLQGMAVIKALLVLPAVALLWWRFGMLIPRRAAAYYIVGVMLMACGTTWISRLTLLAPAALVFHVGLVVLLITTYRDSRSVAPTMML